MSHVKHLGDFLRHEMQQRSMTNHAFADFVGVSHTTINKFVDFGVEDTGYPSIDFLIKLARATKQDIRYLIMLVAPEDTYTTDQEPPRFMPLSEQLERLPKDYRRVVEMIIDLGLDKEQD